MQHQDPYQEKSIIQNIGACIVLSLMTFGLFGLYWQYKQMQILNAWIGREEHVFWRWLFLSILTCGIYEIFEEYKMAQSINQVEHRYKMLVHRNLPATSVILTLIGLGIVATAIQQHHINMFYTYYQVLKLKYGHSAS